MNDRESRRSDPTAAAVRVAWRVAVVAFLLLLAYAAAGFLLAPWLLQRHVPSLLEERIGRAVSVREFRANPFLLSVEALEVSVAGRDGQPLVSAGRLLADASLIGSLRGSVVLDDLRIEGLEANVDVAPDGTWNVAEVVQHWQRSARAPGGGQVAIMVERLALPDARLVVTDRSGSQPAQATIGPVVLEAENLSTTGTQAAPYRLRAKLPEGAALASSGELAMRPAFAASGTLDLRGLQAQTLEPFVRAHSGLAGLQGTLAVSLRHAVGPDGSLQVSDLAFDATGVHIGRRGEAAPMLQAGRIQAGAGAVDFGERVVRLGEVLVANGHLEVRRAGARPPIRPAPPSHASAAVQRAEPPPAWNVRLDSVQVAGLGFRLLAAGKGEAPPLSVGALRGSLRLALQLGGSEPAVVATGIDAQLQDLALALPGEAPVRLARGQVRDARFDLPARVFSAAGVTLSGSATVVRDARGQLVLPVLLAGSGGHGGAGAAREHDAHAWRVAITQLQVPSLRLTLVDKSVEPALKLRAALEGSARVATDRSSSFDFGLSLASGGHLDAAGTASVRQGSARATLRATGIQLRPLQPLLEQFARVQLRSGALSGSVELTYVNDASHPGLRATGTLGVAGLALAEPGSGARLLAWQQLDVAGAELDTHERRLRARQVTVTGPAAKIVVSEDRKLNLTQVLVHEQPSDVNARAADRAKAPFHLEVGRVELRHGEVDFADRSLVLPFSTTVKGVDGTIVDISSEPSHRASLRAEGSIEPYGSARIEGSIVPSDPAAFTDLHVQFGNVQVPPLSPYTATFAGRKVKSGKLWLDLDYRVSDGELQGRNDIRLSDFTLGERVDAPHALDVPLDLVVALLSDGDGQIRLSVPVTGELGDARFSVAAAVRQAIGNVLRRVVSAPFRALGRLFGGDGESLAVVDFLPGSARLRPEQVEKLDALGRALRARPQLRLVVSAPYDPAKDVRALAEERAREKLARALERPAGPHGVTAPIAYDDPATRRALERLLRDQAGDAVVQQVRQQAAAQGARAVAQAMFDRLVAAQQVTEEEGRMLAVGRAREITGYLQQQGIEPSRFRTGRLATQSAGQDGEVTARLELAAAGKD